MPKKSFNASAPAKMGNYHIEVAVPAGADVMTQMLATGRFKERLKHWVEDQTGISPDVQVVNDPGVNAVSVYASDAFMKKIEAQFKDDIAKVERIKSWSELPPEQREPWHRRGPKR